MCYSSVFSRKDMKPSDSPSIAIWSQISPSPFDLSPNVRSHRIFFHDLKTDNCCGVRKKHQHEPWMRSITKVNRNCSAEALTTVVEETHNVVTMVERTVLSDSDSVSNLQVLYPIISFNLWSAAASSHWLFRFQIKQLCEACGWWSEKWRWSSKGHSLQQETWLTGNADCETWAVGIGNERPLPWKPCPKLYLLTFWCSNGIPKFTLVRRVGQRVSSKSKLVQWIVKTTSKDPKWCDGKGRWKGWRGSQFPNAFLAFYPSLFMQFATVLLLTRSDLKTGREQLWLKLLSTGLLTAQRPNPPKWTETKKSTQSRKYWKGAMEDGENVLNKAFAQMSGFFTIEFPAVWSGNVQLSQSIAMIEVTNSCIRNFLSRSRTLLREALIPIREPWNPNVRPPPSVRPCPEKRWFLRRVQARLTRSYPPR